MSSNDYGNLGQEMKTMKDARRNFMAETEDQGRERETQTRKEIEGLGRERKAETRKLRANMKEANADLKDQTHHILGGIRNRMVPGIRKEVAALKAEAGQILTEADKMMAGIHKEVSSLKTEVGRTLADAAKMVGGLARASCERAAAWQDILRTVGGNGRGMPRRAAVAATRSATNCAGRTKANKPMAKTKGSGRSARKAVSGSRSR